MARDVPLAADQLLTERELDSLRFAQDVYGARAKEGAFALGEALELDDATRDQLVGVVAVRLEGLDFEERQKVARGFQELAELLGSRAVGEARPVITRVDEGADATTTNIEPKDERQPQPTAERVTKPVVPAHQADRIEVSVSESEFGNLRRDQFEWLTHFLDHGNVARVAQCSAEVRQHFADALAEKYLTLKVQRLEPANKQKRSQIIRAFLGSQTPEEIMAPLGIRKKAVFNDTLERIAKNITSSMSPNEVAGLLVLSSEPQTVKADEARGPSEKQETATELNELQRNWYKKVFEDESLVELITGLNAGQLDFLAAQLSGFLNSAIGRKQGPFKTARHIKELELLIKGLDYEAISEETRTHISSVKQELHYSAQRIRATVPERRLRSLVNNATLHQDK